jgi:hypothetical protein
MQQGLLPSLFDTQTDQHAQVASSLAPHSALTHWWEALFVT